jgi:hypothetical protein
MTVVGEHHIPWIASIFACIRHMFVDLMIMCILMKIKKRLFSPGNDGRLSGKTDTDASNWLEENNNKNKF